MATVSITDIFYNKDTRWTKLRFDSKYSNISFFFVSKNFIKILDKFNYVA